MCALRFPRVSSAVPSRRPAGLVCLVVLASLAACRSGPDPREWDAVPAGGHERYVYEATARFVHGNYGPSGSTGVPAAWCLVVGRRADVALSDRERDADSWDPPSSLLRRLRKLVPPFVPVSECSWNRNLQEIHRPSGREAVVLAIDFPRWESPYLAEVEVRVRESETRGERWRCRLERSLDGWRILECL